MQLRALNRSLASYQGCLVASALSPTDMDGPLHPPSESHQIRPSPQPRMPLAFMYPSGILFLTNVGLSIHQTPAVGPASQPTQPSGRRCEVATTTPCMLRLRN